MSDAAPPAIPLGQSDADIVRQLSRIPLDYPLRVRWWAGIAMSGALVILLIGSVWYLFGKGVGIWGVNIPTVWGMAIVDVVWWIGIGHAGTFISAMLLILSQGWRNSLNRFAEAMTVFAVFCAVLFPILHLGRPWLFYFMLPYPNSMGVQPQFRSPLLWDVFAFATYFTVSVLFWYIGMVPDFAILRDRARRPFRKIAYGLLALGWRNSAEHWIRWKRAYLLVAVLAMPLVVSVHSGVSLLFAVGPNVGWHSTLFPPYFVLGAVFSGFAVVSLIAISLRLVFGLDNLITDRHFDLLGQFLLMTGLLTAYGYLSEIFFAWYSANINEMSTMTDRLAGTYAPVYWTTILCNVGSIQLLWWRSIRSSMWGMALVGVLVTIGMYTERFMLIITTLYHGFVPGQWYVFVPTFWDWSVLFGTIGLFIFLMLLFVRFLPLISMFEVQETLHEEREQAHG